MGQGRHTLRSISDPVYPRPDLNSDRLIHQHQMASLTLRCDPHALRHAFFLGLKAVVVASTATPRETTTLLGMLVEVPRQYRLIALTAIHLQPASLCTVHRQQRSQLSALCSQQSTDIC